MILLIKNLHRVLFAKQIFLCRYVQNISEHGTLSLKANRERVNDELRSRRPLKSTNNGRVQNIKDLVLKSWRLIIKNLAH